MRRVAGLSAIAALLASQVAPFPGFAAGSIPSIGINAAIRNVVQVRIVNQQDMRRAVLRDDVHIGDTVTSGPNSALQVLLMDQTVFTVGANARMTIDRFVFDPNKGTGSVAASVARGAFRFMSGRAAHNPGQIQIKTPVASIGVRGTIVEVLVGEEALALMKLIPGYVPGSGDPSTATLVVLRGPGPKREGTDKIGAIDVTANGKTVSLDRAGIMIIPGPGQDPIGPFPLPASIGAQLDASLSTTPSSDSQREVIAELNTSILDKLKPGNGNAAVSLARLVLDNKGNPAALQAALAAAAAQYPADSDTFKLLVKTSLLVMISTQEPAVDVISHELALEEASPLLYTYNNAENTDLANAMTSLVTVKLASVEKEPATAPEWFQPADTLLKTTTEPQIRESRQGSAH